MPGAGLFPKSGRPDKAVVATSVHTLPSITEAGSEQGATGRKLEDQNGEPLYAVHNAMAIN